METFSVDKKLLKIKGVFDFSGMYKYMKKWMVDRHYEFHEKKFKEKPKGHFFPDKEISWWAEKKLTDYIKFRIEISMHLWNAEPVQISKNGEKKDMINGRMEITIKGDIITDYSKEFEKSSLFKNIENFLNKRILYKDILLKYADSFDYELFAFENDIKKYLGMEISETAYGVPHTY